MDLNGVTIKNSNQYPIKVSQTFMDIGLGMCLEQIVDFPTRGDNTLDLIFTSHPSHKIRCKPLLPTGLKSGHDIVLLDTSLQAVRATPVKRKIYLWKKADTENIKTTRTDYCRTFPAERFASVEDMWQNLKSALTNNTMEKFVPSKISSSKYTHSWVNTKIPRATHRKQRAHRKAKLSTQKKDWDRYKDLQSSVQKEIRYAHRKMSPAQI